MIRIKFLTIFVAVMVLLAAAPAARAGWLIDQFGQVTAFGQSGQVLGEEKRGSAEEFKTETKPDERKTEIRFGDENRIKTDFKPGEFKTEIRQGETRLRMERKNGEVKMKIKNEATGEERELELKKETEVEAPEMETGKEEELLRIKDREDKNEVRVGSDSGRFVIKRNKVGAVSDFPLSVDLSTNTLSVTTPAGEKQVTVLPDQAVQNMLSRNVIDRVGGQNQTNATDNRIRMSQNTDGSLIYEVEGEKQERLFGFLPMKFKKTAVVSAETGELIETKQAFTDRILDFISF